MEAGQIVSVRSTKPRDVEHAISTGGVILPGLIDLHGHPEFAAWERPGVYINRGRWRDSDEYDQLIKKPWARLTSGGKSVSVKTAMTRYAEVRAAVSEATVMIHGTALSRAHFDQLAAVGGKLVWSPQPTCVCTTRTLTLVLRWPLGCRSRCARTGCPRAARVCYIR